MFHQCSSLTSLNISNFNTEKVNNVLGIFYNCEKALEDNSEKFKKFIYSDMIDE